MTDHSLGGVRERYSVLTATPLCDYVPQKDPVKSQRTDLRFHVQQLWKQLQVGAVVVGVAVGAALGVAMAEGSRQQPWQ